ncbi:tetratricopeptide repeat protein [Brucepastera parasyntrophica]|uniref:tetratricopeptide repeat protein n=1 Tax=Brucepastera parasyntrophica TaxID=2880008 RepID=UPI00210F0FBA|nr:tetratricopeptide repeat protein [Brucepastera parasyntrophica]ULQ60909.1 tetratricopeptide repeat protein [Brucepastera parasyntrophica]
MKILSKQTLFVLCGLLCFVFFACKTQPPERPGPEKPVEKGYSRVAFAEELQRLLAAEKTDEALALFDTVPEWDASSLAIQKLKLSILISAGYLDQATALAGELEKQYPANADILYIQSILASARKDSRAHIAYLNKTVQADPGHSDAMAQLGYDFLVKKNYKQAKNWLLKSIAANPENQEALLYLARVYYMQEELSQAQSTLNLALQKNPESDTLWAEMARVKYDADDRAGALKDIQRAISIDPNVYEYRIDCGLYLFNAGKLKDARVQFTEAIRIDPEQFLAYIYRAGLNDDLGYKEEAISDYKYICKIFPQYYYATEALGVLLWEKKDYVGSFEAFKQALYYSPQNSSYALMMTLAYYQMNQPAEARNFMGKYIATLDRNTTEYYLCRMFAERTGDADVLNRIMKETQLHKRYQMLYYMAAYYDISKNKSLAQKTYNEVVAFERPTFFEYRLAAAALETLGS